MYKQRDVETLWNKYSNLLSSLKSENVDNLINSWDQRIIMGTYSQREKEPFCGIGGLVEYALDLAKKSNEISKALNYNINKASIVKCSLLSIIGKVGNLTQNRFVDCTSEWHQNKLGQYYDWNEECDKYQTTDMTLFILQRFNIDLSWEEWQAIFLLKDNSSDDNKFYSDYKTHLTLVLQMAHQAVIKEEKDKIVGTHTVPF